MAYKKTESFTTDSTSSTTGYVSDDFPAISAPSGSSTSNTVDQDSCPNVMLQLMERGLTSADEQIEELLTGLKYSQNIYTLKYILEHKGDFVSMDMLDTAVKSLCSQEFDEAFSEETTIKLEWQLRIIVTILELMCQKDCQFTRSFVDCIRQATSKYKDVHSKIVRHGAETWKPKDESAKATKSFNNYDNKYLLKLIKNTLDFVCDYRNQYQTNVDQAITALKGSLVAVPGLARADITEVEVSFCNFDIERSWKFFKEAVHVEALGKPWYVTWRQLIMLQDSLDKWHEQESAISVSFKERVLLEYLWYHISLCYAEDAAVNQDVSDELWFGILDIIQKLVQKTMSTTTQAICYYMALDSLNNAITETIQFKSIEILLSLEAKNDEIFVTTADDIAGFGCDEKYIPRMVSMYCYLKEKLEVESKMILQYSTDQTMTNDQDVKQQGKGKGKGKNVEKNPIDYIAEDLTCAIICETVGDFYQLNCQHLLSSKAFLSLNTLECPYCRHEIKKDKVYYLPQQTIFNNVQHYITDTDDQDVYTAHIASNANGKLFDGYNDIKKQKRKNKRRPDFEATWNSIWRSLTVPNLDKLFQKAKTAYEKKKLEKAINIYTQILRADPTNYVALCNRAKIKLDMKNFVKALFDIGSAIEANKVYNDAWFLSLMTHVGLENKKDVEQTIGHIRHLSLQKKAFDMIYELVNKPEFFDVEWFKILVDSYSLGAMEKLDNIDHWKSLCDHQHRADHYIRWYNTAVTWHYEYNNARYNYQRVNAFFEKIYYMHKTYLKAHFVHESHIEDNSECCDHEGYLYIDGSNSVTIPIFQVPPNKYRLGFLLRNYRTLTTITIIIKTSTEEIHYNTYIERNYYDDTEYVMPCTIDVWSEDDIIIKFAISKSDVRLYWVCLYSEEKFEGMERNLKMETFPNGVKMIDYNQYRYPDNTHAIYC